MANSNVIDGPDYVALATDYAQARSKILQSVQYFLNAVTVIVDLNNIDPEIDLLSDFYNVYLTNMISLQSDGKYLTAVRSLNNHVLTRSAYATIDAYLTGTAVKVPQAWATLCAEVGQTISNGNISNPGASPLND